jgi:hypothetical protein
MVENLSELFWGTYYDATPEVFQFKCGAGAHVLQAKSGTAFAAPALTARRG